MIKLGSLHLCASLCLLAGAVFAPALAAQAVAPAARIHGSIDESELVTLGGNTYPAANAKNDRGAVSASFAMPDLTLVLSRGAKQEAAFEEFIKGQYDPNSPSFHQWLTPQQIGEQYGPAPADVAAITGWLSSHGFAIRSVAQDRMSIRFGGTAGQVQSAFHTSIHNLTVNGVAHIGNMSDPQIPAALAPVVAGVKSLHNFLPHPLHKAVGQASFNREAGQWQHLAAATSAAAPSSASASPAAASGLRPQLGINVPGGANNNAYLEEDVTPWDFATIYNVIPAWNAGYTGSGQTIAIAGTSLITQSDVTTFRSDFGLPALASFQQIDTGYGPKAVECKSTSPYAICGIGDLDENTLDVEWSGAVAPGASIALVVTGQNSAGTVDTVYDSAQYVIQNETAKILNVSYGACELAQGTAQNVAFYNLWQSAAAEGIAVFVAAGDSGSPSCDQGGDSIGWPYPAQYGLTVSGLASTPYNVAVGGTDFSWCQPVIDGNGNLTGCPSSTSTQGSPKYWSSSSTSGNTNNGSAEPYESALGYIPETPWNDSCLNPIQANYLSSLLNYFGYPTGSSPEAACNSVENNWSALDSYYYNTYGSDLILAPYIDTIGGSGGASNCVVNTTDPNSTSFPSGSCTTGATSTGGTSGSIPLTNNGWQKPSWQVGAESLGVPNDGVRDIPDVSFFAADGALDSAYLVCVSADGSCTYSSTVQNTYQEFGGTSFGSPAMAGVMALINQKAGAPQGLPNQELYNLASLQTYSSCSAEKATNNSSCYFQSIDQGTNAMPCDLGAPVGGVTVNSSGSYTQSQQYAGINSPNCTALITGDTVGTLTSTAAVTTANSSGAAYNAVTGYNMATGLGSLNVYHIVRDWVSNVGTASSTMNVQLSSNSISASQSLTVTVTMTGSGSYGAPTGNITVSGGGYSSSLALASGQAVITIPASSLAPGSVTLTVYYGGDSNYAAQNSPESVTVTAVIPTVAVSTPTTGNLANAVYVSVVVSGPASAPTPTGTVSLAQSGGTYTSTATALSSAGVANFTIPANTLTVGADTLTATYSGSSSYYAGATGTAQITISNAALLTPTITVKPTPSSINSSQSLNVAVSVSGAGAVPTGYATLTASGYSSGLTLLSGGSATITINSNTLKAGTDTLTASYSGDAIYGPGTPGTNTVTVTQSAYSLTATTPAAVSPGATATSTIGGAASTTNYSGTVTLGACSLSSSPSGAQSLPSCSASGTITYANGTPSGNGTATVTTTATTTASLARPKLPGNKGWLGAGSGAVLALLVFFGIPARRRSWRSMLSVLVALAALGTLVSCSSNTSSNVFSVPGTTAGPYTFTVQGTGSDPASTTETVSFTVTVN